MIEFIKNWVVNTITVVMLVILIEMLIPSGKMKKMVNLVSGFILVIALINPVLKVLGKEIMLREMQMADSNYIDKKEIMASSGVLEENQIKQITNLYRDKIIEQLESITKEVKGIEDARADVIINEDYTSDRFGEVKKVYLYIKTQKRNDGVKPVLSVKKIEIGNGNSKDGSSMDEDSKDEMLSEKQLDKKSKQELEE
ncbi:MAG TPA: stage III sporulation protein AF, partial [Acetivibrio sp.]|nr:stage III sporulation protein AF [Acetivibrio sp.]